MKNLTCLALIDLPWHAVKWPVILYHIRAFRQKRNEGDRSTIKAVGRVHAFHIPASLLYRQFTNHADMTVPLQIFSEIIRFVIFFSGDSEISAPCLVAGFVEHVGRACVKRGDWLIPKTQSWLRKIYAFQRVGKGVREIARDKNTQPPRRGRHRKHKFINGSAVAGKPRPLQTREGYFSVYQD